MFKICEGFVCFCIVSLALFILAGTAFVFWIKTSDSLMLLMVAILFVWGFFRAGEHPGRKKKNLTGIL